MEQEMRDYNITAQNNPNKTHEWVRQRVLGNLEPHPLERDQRNLKNETSRRDSVICAAFKSGKCKNGGRCKMPHAGSTRPP
eukprot:3126624-Pyramimonas_sp.AAC.1